MSSDLVIKPISGALHPSKKLGQNLGYPHVNGRPAVSQPTGV